jgi:hypothetical protein
MLRQQLAAPRSTLPAAAFDDTTPA